jgi:O-antigen ligase/polysaccharide polymerase Wzy-like membrane protein
VTGRLPVLVLAVLVVGLAVHNLAMATLWDWGVRGTALDVVSAWKEALLGLGLAAAIWHARRLPPLQAADLLAAVCAGIVVLYALIPQGWLDGAATSQGEVLALRHHLTPVAAYALGRLLVVSSRDRRLLVWLAVAVGAGLAVWGLADAYLVSLQWWRESGVPGWYREQLGLAYRGLSGLPENWVFNTGDEENPLRRVVSTFLSPLATAYVLVVVLLLLAARRPTRWTLAAAALCYAGLLWTHTRAAFIALPAGLLVLALLRRSMPIAGLAAGSVAVSVVFVALFPTIGPSTTYTAAELLCLRENAAKEGVASDDPFSAGESSTSSHLSALRDGIHTVARHPWGYGLGNSGVSASRTIGSENVKAGESTYTELGVDTGVLGLLAFAGWLVTLVLALRARSPWLAASVAAVAVLGLQTDVIGIHWLSVVVFALAGAALRGTAADEPPEAAV